MNSMVDLSIWLRSFPILFVFYGFFTACLSSSPSFRTWMEGRPMVSDERFPKKPIQWLLDPHGWDSIDLSPFSLDFPVDFPMSHAFSGRLVAPAPRTSGPQLRHVLLPLPDTASAAVPQLPQALREIYDEVLTEAKLEPWCWWLWNLSTSHEYENHGGWCTCIFV